MTTVRFENMPSWQGASTCTGSVTPGARALMAYWLEQFEPLAKSMGIYNCRTVRGGSTTSMHGEGRACDCGVPVTDEGHRVMYRFLSLLGPHARRLGIQYVIFNRVQWSASRPATGDYYGGVHPHTDHAHIELSWNSARNLTLATLRAVAGDFRGEEDDDEDNGRSRGGSSSTSPSSSWPATPKRLTRNGSRNLMVGVDQGLLMSHGQGPGGLVSRSGVPDRRFGDGTERCVRSFQQLQDVASDGIIGPQTRARLLAPLGSGLVRRDASGAAVGRVQGLLLGWGYGPKGLVGNTGRPDRSFGPTTERLLRTFQRDRGITVDGVFGPESMRAALYR